MQRLSVIALIIVFLLSQYGRNLAYLECRLYNLVQNGAGIRCDCEKMTPRTDAAGKPDVPPLQKATGVHLDEHFIQAGPLPALDNTISIQKSSWPVASQPARTGFASRLLRPPRFIA